MSNKHLATYLNDHLAGAITAIELLSHLESAYADKEPAGWAAALRADIEADRKELEGLMVRWGVSHSPPRKAAAGVAQKLAELKLRLDDPAAGAFRLFETPEAVSLGIEGKRSLWRSLAAAAERSAAFQGVDYGPLIRRAEEQRARTEAVRLEAAKAALAGDDAP